MLLAQGYSGEHGLLGRAQIHALFAPGVKSNDQDNEGLAPCATPPSSGSMPPSETSCAAALLRAGQARP